MALVSEFAAALNQVCSEKGLSPEAVLATIETALVAAYRKDFGGSIEELEAKVDLETGEAKVFKDGEDVTPDGFGRIAAQTAKQVLIQKLREEEKQAIISEYEAKIGQVTTGHVFRLDQGNVIVDFGRAQGVMPPAEQLPGESYRTNQRLLVLILRIEEGRRGPQIIISRAAPRFIEELFALEVPEIHSGVVKIEGIAREPGSRTKVAVSSSEKNVDPVGSCVGQKGVRVQAVIAEIGNEKIDIIPFSEITEKYIAAALSPAEVIEVQLSSQSKEARVEVPEDQLSLAIGREGQNVRLAAKLTGWKIDLRGAGSKAKKEESVSDLAQAGLSKRVVNALAKAKIESLEDLRAQSKEELNQIKGLGPKALAEIEKVLGK